MVTVAVDPGGPNGMERSCPAAVETALIVIVAVLSLGLAVTVMLATALGTSAA
jgi:hypothetical protein